MSNSIPKNIYLTLDESAQYYECGFSCDNALILRIKDERYFITDSRYTLEAKELCKSHTEIIESANFIQSAQNVLEKLNVSLSCKKIFTKNLESIKMSKKSP